MLFDFLKKLFWRASEGGEKRKLPSNDSNEELMQSKRCRYEKSQCEPREMRSDALATYTKKIRELAVDSFAVDSVNDHDDQSNQANLQRSDSNDDLSFLQGFKIDDCSRDSQSEHLLCKTPRRVHQSVLMEAQKSDGVISFKSMLHVRVPSNRIFPRHPGHLPNSSTVKPFDDSYLLNSKIHQPLAHGVIKHHSLCLPTPSLSKFKYNMHELPQNRTEQKKVDRVMLIEASSRLRRNTLKEKFFDRDVIKRDYICQIAKRYEKREKRCFKELDELHRMISILARHNQYLRESVLDNCLNHSLLMVEAVLDERHEEEVPELPKLNPDMIKHIQCALSKDHGDEVLSQKYGLRITRKDILTLAGLNWLNDEVINFYMNLIITRGEDDDFPNVYAMNTFFYPKLISGGHASLRRWTRKIDIFSKDILIIPIHLGIHWCMSVVDFRHKSIQYYDSMGSPNNKCLDLLKQYIYEESVDKKKKPYNFEGWNFECVQDIPRQMNGSDCGVFSCMFAEYISANRDFNFSQDDMPYFRNKMIYEILTAKLL